MNSDVHYQINVASTLDPIVSAYISGLKVGWRMTRTIRVTFLVGQVGLIHKLNYLDVTRISHVL